MPVLRRWAHFSKKAGDSCTQHLSSRLILHTRMFKEIFPSEWVSPSLKQAAACLQQANIWWNRQKPGLNGWAPTSDWMECFRYEWMLNVDFKVKNFLICSNAIFCCCLFFLFYLFWLWHIDYISLSLTIFFSQSQDVNNNNVNNNKKITKNEINK